MKLKAIKVAVISAVLAITPLTQAGIPVVDGTQAANMVQQLAHNVEQVAKLKAQLEQMQAQYKALTGSRDVSALFNQSGLKNYLPQDWQKVYDTVQSGGYKGLDGTAKAMADAAGIMSKCKNYSNSQQKSACENAAAQSIAQKDMVGQAFDKASARLNQIDSMISRIKTTQDPKEIADLQARIQGEQAAIQNEATKLQLYQMMAQANEKIAQQQKRKANAETVARTAKLSAF